MPTFVFANWPMGIPLGEAIQQAIIVQARLSDYDHLAPGNTTVANANLAEIFNRAIEEWLEALPVLGQKTVSITLTGGQNAYPIPTDMLGRQIVQIRFSNDGVNAGFQKRPIQFFGQFGKVNLPSWVLSGGQQWGLPQGFTLDKTAENIEFYPFPNAGYIVEIDYQQDYTPITGAMVADPVPTPPADPVVIGELPSTWINAFAARVGAEVLQSIDASGAQALYSYASQFLQRVSKRLTQLQAADQPIQQGAGSFAANPLYASQFNAFVR